MEAKQYIILGVKSRINQIFDLLDNWKELPAYQLERRADIFFALYLPEILNQKPFELDITHDNIIPEFPVKKDNSNLSNKIDYVVVSEKKKTIYLIELKTEMCSIRPEQDKYLKDASEKTIKDLVKDILTIADNSKSEKYKHLLACMEKAGIDINSDANDYKIEVIYILPEADEPNISFSKIIEILKGNDDELTKRFVKSLEKWKEKQ
jgi:hypothetical protein